MLSYDGTRTQQSNSYRNHVENRLSPPTPPPPSTFFHRQRVYSHQVRTSFSGACFWLSRRNEFVSRLLDEDTGMFQKNSSKLGMQWYSTRRKGDKEILLLLFWHFFFRQYFFPHACAVGRDALFVICCRASAISSLGNSLESWIDGLIARIWNCWSFVVLRRRLTRRRAQGRSICSYMKAKCCWVPLVSRISPYTGGRCGCNAIRCIWCRNDHSCEMCVSRVYAWYPRRRRVGDGFICILWFVDVAVGVFLAHFGNT